MKKWNFFRFLGKPIRRPIRNRPPLLLEELECRTLFSVNVLTYHDDIASTGVNANEIQLSPANVHVGSFGKLFTTPVDGQVYAEPLVETGVSITGGPNTSPGAVGVHDVVFVATENDSLYAIDAGVFGGQILWQRSFIDTTNPDNTVFTTPDNAVYQATTVAPVPNADTGSADINPVIGITGTPVIDPATNTLYLVTKTKETINNAVYYVQRLHAINVADGTDRVTPFTIGGTTNGNTNVSSIFVNGTGDGNDGQGHVYFNALREAERGALGLVNNTIYVEWASHGDNGPYHGWVASWDVSNLATQGLKLSGVLNDDPNGGEAGIWQGGGRLAFEADGSAFYFETGNGPGGHGNPVIDPVTDLPADADYYESLVKVTADPDPLSGPTHQNANGWGMKIVDFFTPYNEVALDNADADFGSGGPLLLPDSAGIPGHPHLMLAAGKQGTVYLIDRDHLGGYDPNNDNVLNSVPNGSGNNTPPVLIGGSLSTPAYFNGEVYWTSGYSSTARAFTINANGTLTTTSQTTATFGYLPGSAVISSDGTNNGIVWVMDRNLNEIHAYDASTFSTELWNSGQKAGGADSLGAVVKFAVPTVANGEVYVGTSNSLVVYGLTPPADGVPETPTLTATALSGSSVSLNWTDPTTLPNTASGYLVEQSTDDVNFTQVTTAPAGATSLGVGGLAQNTTYYFRIRGFNGYGGVGYSAYSNVAQATTTNQVAAIDFSAGFTGIAGILTLNGSALIPSSTTKLELTNGQNGEAGSAFTDSPVDVTKFATQFTFQLTNPNADGMTFTIQGVGPNALGPSGGALGYGDGTSASISNSVAIKFDLYNNNGEGVDSTGLYLNGAAPFNVGSIDLTGTGIDLHSGDPFLVNMAYDGTTLSVLITDTITNASASQNYIVNIPGAVGGGTAYVGFTGGTGGLAAIQDILNWTFSPNASQAPTAPSGLGATAATATTVLLAWTNNAANQTGYHLDRATDLGFTQNLITENLPATPSTFTDSYTGLAPGGTYYYRLRAANNAGDSANSNVAMISIPLAPAKPTDAVVTGVATNEIDLSWTDNAGVTATGYLIERRVGNGAFTNYVKLPARTDDPPGAYTWSDFGVAPGTAYEYHILAYNSSGNNDFTGTNAETLTLAPGGVTATAGNGVVNLSWNAPTGAVSYNVYRGTTTGTETLYAQNQPGTVFADAAATNGQTYYYTVTAVNANTTYIPAIPFESAPSGEVSATPNANAPAAPTSLIATPGDGTVTLTWTAAAGSVSYSVYRGTASGNEAPTALATNVTATTFPDTSVVNGTTYFYTVAAVNASGQSNRSNEASATPQPSGPAAPTNLVAAAISASQVMLTWTDNATNETGFKIERSADGTTFTQVGTVGANVTTFIDSGLLQATQYFYRVRATNTAADSAPTNIANVLTQTPVNASWSDGDIGAPAIAGSYSQQNGVFTINAAGNDIWNNADQFHYVYQPLTGDGTIIARVASETDTDPWAKAGVMIRETLAAGSTQALMAATPGNGIVFQYRTQTDNGSGWPGQSAVGAAAPYWVELVRSGNTLTGFTSPDGVTWTQAGTISIPMAQTVYVGLALTSHNTGALNTSTFDNVSVSVPVPVAPAAPTSLVAAASGSSQVNLTWADNSNNEAGFQIEQSTDGVNFVQIAVANPNATGFLVGALQPSTAYTFRVRAFNAIGESAYSNSQTVSTPAGSPAPAVVDYSAGFAAANVPLTDNGSSTIVGSGLQLTDGGGNEAGSAFTGVRMGVSAFTNDFTFQIASGTNPTADGMMFVIQGVGPTALGQSGGGLGFGYDTSGAGVGVTPSVGVKFDLYSNEGEGVDSTGLYIDGAAPTVAGSIDLSNSGVDLHSGHLFHASMIYDGANLSVTITDTMTNAAATQTYQVNIPAVLGATTGYVGFTGGTGGLTAVQTVQTWKYTPAFLPGQPTNLAVAPNSGTQATLTWQESDPSATSFTVERSGDGVQFVQIATTTAPTYVDASLTSGSTYFYRVRALNGVGFSAYASPASITTPVIPLAPTAGHVTLDQAHEIDLAWTDNANNETGYQVYRQDGGAGPFNLIAAPGANTISYQDHSVAPATTYDYHIQAYNLAGASGFIDIGAESATVAPAGPAITSDGTQLTLTWTPTTGAATYNVYRSTTSLGEGSMPYATGLTSASFVDAGVSDGVTYFYQVSAVNAAGVESLTSPQATATFYRATTHLGLSLPDGAVAGSSFQITVSALDASNHVATGYQGTVHFSSPNAGQSALLPADYMFTLADHGQHTFTATLFNAGSKTLAVADAAPGTAIVGASAGVTITPNNATQLVVSQQPANATAGQAIPSFAVAVQDAYGNVVTTDSSTVALSVASGPGALSGTTSAAATNGVATFAGAVLQKAGGYKLRASDGALTAATSGAFTVSPAGATHLAFVQQPTNATAGQAIAPAVTVQLLDAYNNLTTSSANVTLAVATGPTGSQPLSGTTTVAAVNGVATFNNVSLKTAGAYTLTAASTGLATLTSGSFTVSPAATSTFVVAGYVTVTTAGTSHTFTVTAKDAYGNTTTGYRGTIHFTSNDVQAGLPANYTFTAANKGVQSFSATLKTAGSRSLTVADTVTPGITGVQSGITVNAAAAASLSLSGPSSVKAGAAFSVTVTLKDAYGNIATGYRGTVKFSSSDASAVLPKNYTFTAADNGTHTFSGIVLKKTGTRSLTVADTKTSGLNATLSIVVG